MKLGVVLEGGAAYCSFQAGVLDELHRQGIRFHHVTGVSAGALNGCAVVLNQIEELLDMWRLFKGLRIINWKHLQWNRSPFDLSRITKEAIETHCSPHKLSKASIELAVVTTRLPNFKRHIYTNRDDVDMVDAIRASNLIPLLHSRLVRIDGAFHIDGGFVDNVPIDVPFEKGCDRVIAIVHNPWGKVYRKLFPPRSAKLEKYDGKVIVIHPPQFLPLLFPFDFHGERMEKTFKIGRKAARQALKENFL